MLAPGGGSTRVQVPYLTRAWYSSDIALFHTENLQASETDRGSIVGSDSDTTRVKLNWCLGL